MSRARHRTPRHTTRTPRALPAAASRRAPRIERTEPPPRTPERPRAPNAASPPSADEAETRARARRPRLQRSSSAAFLPRFRDQLRNTVQLLLRELRAFASKNGGDDLLGGAIEKRVDQVPKCRFPGRPARHRGNVNVPKAMLLVGDMSLLF